MNAVKSIRALLGETQAELAEAIDVSQASVSFYENGKEPPTDVARRLIAHARDRSVPLTMDQIYGLTPLPPASESTTQEG